MLLSKRLKLLIADHRSMHLPMTALPNPILPRTGPTSRPANSVLNRAGPLEMQTHQECPPRRITPLECTLTKNAPVSSLECTVTKSLDLKCPGITFLQKRGGGGGLRLYRGKAPKGASDIMRYAPRSESWRSSKALPFLSPEAPASVDTPAVDFFDYVASNT